MRPKAGAPQGVAHHGWIVTYDIGEYGTDYLRRAATLAARLRSSAAA
ncbi:hypothetical protein OHS81_37185 [Streptomyces sp. NBC_00400]